ncbi:V-type ATP synthase subunit D [Ruminococcus sp. Marseille-P6503]|uniref:V-type ATP synthase subunit D n=1 Tax=Ruminococcus sp. Marseille-P6503 TaxID=2364796 RepID=UPI000F52472D|nr:V-type ATP synthase subunit D [Ruminococcus sp. Marseille-P6503]
MAEQQVFPTKGNLIASKKALQLAALGYELLDRKRNILIRELMGLVDKAGELRASIEETYVEAYAALQLANISLGLVTPYAECVPIEKGLEITSRSVMGVELPQIRLEERPLKVTYGFSQTTSQLDKAFIAFDKVKKKTVLLAEVENSIYRLSAAIKKTQRRANALQNIIIPRNQAVVKFISDSLDEKEREEFSRLKVIKASKLKKAREAGKRRSDI